MTLPQSKASAAITAVLEDPAASYWLKSALTESLKRDIVDAANDAEVLATLLDQLARE